jgi:spore coat protein U-like protein
MAPRESRCMSRVPGIGLRLVAAALIAAAGAVRADSVSMAVSAVVPSKNNCKFSTGTLSLPFGVLNQLGTGPLSVSATIDFVCNGASPSATYSVTASDGANSTGPAARRMANQTTAGSFLPYSLSLAPTGGTVAKGTPVTLTATGTLQAADYQNALVGTYQDTVVLTVSP